MTVAALLFSTSIPVVITDHLISTEHSGTEPSSLKTPLVSQESRSGLQNYRPVGLSKKLWKHSDNTYMLYAGIVDDAKKLFEYLKTKLVYVVEYSDEIHNDLVHFVDTNRLNVSFIIVCKKQDGFIHHFYHSAENSNLAIFGNIIAVGSGAKPLTELLDIHHVAKLPTSDQMPEHLYAVMLNSLRALAILTLDYMKHNSKLAEKSTGGLFDITYLPTLYGYDVWEKTHKYFTSGICQIFTEVLSEKTIITRLVISQPTEEATTQTIVFTGERELNGSDEFEFNLNELDITYVGSTRGETVESYNMSPINIECNQVVVYSQRSFNCPHDLKSQTHKTSLCLYNSLIQFKSIGQVVTMSVNIEIFPFNDDLKNALCPECNNSH